MAKCLINIDQVSVALAIVLVCIEMHTAPAKVKYVSTIVNCNLSLVFKNTQLTPVYSRNIYCWCCVHFQCKPIQQPMPQIPDQYLSGTLPSWPSVFARKFYLQLIFAMFFTIKRRTISFTNWTYISESRKSFHKKKEQKSFRLMYNTTTCVASSASANQVPLAHSILPGEKYIFYSHNWNRYCQSLCRGRSYGGIL